MTKPPLTTAEHAKIVQNGILRSLADARVAILPHELKAALASLAALLPMLVDEIDRLKAANFELTPPKRDF